MARRYTDVKRERKEAMRAVRRAQRAHDTEIEKLERTVFRKLARKTILTLDDANEIVGKFTSLLNKLKPLEKAIADFITIVSL